MNHFAAAILTYLRTISETTLAGVEKDSSQLLTFFSTYTKVEKVGSGLYDTCTIRLCGTLIHMLLDCCLFFIVCLLKRWPGHAKPLHSSDT